MNVELIVGMVVITIGCFELGVIIGLMIREWIGWEKMESEKCMK